MRNAFPILRVVSAISDLPLEGLVSSELLDEAPVEKNHESREVMARQNGGVWFPVADRQVEYWRAKGVEVRPVFLAWR